MGIPFSPGRAARPEALRLSDTDVGAIPGDATDGILVTREEAKTFLALDHDQQDALVTTLIHAGEQEAEAFLNRDLRERSYQAVFTVAVAGCQAFATGRPAASVTAVKMWDATGAETTLSSTGEDADYAVRAGRGGELTVVLSSDAVQLYRNGSNDGDLMLLEFDTADASAATLVGYHAIKRAVLHKVNGGFEAREETAQGAPFQHNDAAERLMRPYRHVLPLAGA